MRNIVHFTSIDECPGLFFPGLCATLARMSDIVGRRTVICGSFAVFLCASMACGASRTLSQLIGFRALQGVAGGGLLSIGVIVVVDWLSLERLVLTCTILGGVVAAAGILGPVVGGLLTKYASWRYVFWIKYVVSTLSISSTSRPCHSSSLVALLQ